MFGFDNKDIRLTINFLKINIRDRYLASSIGSIWAIVNPLLMLSLYTFVFGFVYKSKLPGAETTLAYAMWMICGYGPWISISESISSSTLSVTSASGLVKNMAFKTELLPISGALTGLVSLFVTLAFLLVLVLVGGSGISWQIVLLPLIVLIQLIFVTSIGFFLSATNIFFRDVGFALPNILTIILFSSPIFYSIEALPASLKVVSYFNPFFVITDSYRKVLVFHETPDFLGLSWVAILGAILFYLGLGFFRRLKGNFEGRL